MVGGGGAQSINKACLVLFIVTWLLLGYSNDKNDKSIAKNSYPILPQFKILLNISNIFVRYEL